MTTISGGALAQQLYQRLFDRLDIDGDQSLSAQELQAADKTQSAESLAKAFGALDGDSDGKIGRAEMTGPAFSFGGETLSALVTAQAASGPASPRLGVATFAARLPSPTPEQAEQVAALFARADLDGDGLLSKDEMAAEGAVRRAANLDAGYVSGPIFYSIDADNDGLLSPGEVHGGGAISAVTPSKVTFFDERSPEDQKRWLDYVRDHNARDPDHPLPTPTILSAAEKQRQRDQMAADHAERTSGPAGTIKILARDLAGAREKAAQDFAATPLTDALATRLMRQFLSGWNAQPATEATVLA